MKTTSFIFSMMLATLFFLAGCSINENDEKPEISLTEKTAQLLKAENQFGFELFKQIYTSENDERNIMVSPLSVSLALAMTYNGANGETKTAMEKTLKVYGLTPDDINESYQSLVNDLQSMDQNVLLEIANAIYYADNFSVEQDFISINREYYNAEVTALDFGAPDAVTTINGWVAEKTHDKIESIVDFISRDDVMFLLNAIYFKGIWQTEFNTANTKKLPFIPEDGETIQTETMHRVDTLPYVSNDLFSAVQLAYGNGSYNLYVFLPEKGKRLSEITDMLNEENWETWLQSFRETESVDIKLPRFKYGYEMELNDVLTKMGMGVAFTPAADFTGISRNSQLWIDYVKHKTFVEVNEEGTEAAAVTVVAITRGMDPEVVPFHVNRPFMYAVTEKDSGAVLFIGTVKNPKLNQ